jgi:glycosyltransferase involved in cell wall biosynthesis
MSEPLISVIMPCYNHGRFLPEAVASLQAQVCPHWECIIVNDGSTDDTAQVAAKLATDDSRVRLISQENRGLSAARNRGLAEARGQLVHFLDADDYILPEMYRKMAQMFQTRSDVSVVYCGYQFVTADRELLNSIPALPESADVFHDLLERNLWPCHAVMVRKTALDAVAVFDEALNACEDWDLWLRIASTERKFVPVSGEFACYRRLSDSMSSDGWHMLDLGFAVIEKNSHWHKACRLCKAAATRGRHRWCGYCWKRIGSQVTDAPTSDLLAYVRLFLRMARTDLRLTWWVMGTLFRKLTGLHAIVKIESSPLNAESGK